MTLLRHLLVSLLTLEARFVLLRYRPQVIAITGSVGKTTSKDAIYAAISSSMYVRKSQKSYNSELGVPLTILGLENAWHSPVGWIKNLISGLLVALPGRTYPNWLVLEVGADRPGDIQGIAAWLRPHIVVLTGVPEMPVHVEYFSSVDELVKEKRSLAVHLRQGGKLVLNADDDRMRALIPDFRGACVTYGVAAERDFTALNPAIAYEGARPVGMTFRLEHSGSSVPVVLRGALGLPRVYAALAALAVADIVGVDEVSAAKALAGWDPPPGRMRLIEGAEGSLIIDDTYNSSPAAAMAALDTMRAIQGTGRKIAVFGDMLELGKYSADAHRSVGSHAAACVDSLYTVGHRARGMAQAARDAGVSADGVVEFEIGEVDRIAHRVQENLEPKDVVLVKGSQGMRLERVVKALMADPDQAADLLVRQDEEWTRR